MRTGGGCVLCRATYAGSATAARVSLGKQIRWKWIVRTLCEQCRARFRIYRP